jgi:hypothetical protein
MARWNIAYLQTSACIKILDDLRFHNGSLLINR